MPCSICGRTMQRIGYDSDNSARTTFWCSGCGSLVEYTGDFSRQELPADLRHVIAAASGKVLTSGQIDVTVVYHCLKQNNTVQVKQEIKR